MRIEEDRGNMRIEEDRDKTMVENRKQADDTARLRQN